MVMMMRNNRLDYSGGNCVGVVCLFVQVVDLVDITIVYTLSLVKQDEWDDDETLTWLYFWLMGVVCVFVVMVNGFVACLCLWRTCS